MARDQIKNANAKRNVISRRGLMVGAGGASIGAIVASEQSFASQSSEGRLTLGMASEPSTLDPQMSAEQPAHNITFNVIDSLLGRDENQQIVPALAESWQALDELTYEFRLRPGVVFHNGEPFNAEVVKWNYDRILDPDQNSTSRPMISPVESVEVVDDLTVLIRTTDPFPLVFATNTMPLIGLLPPKYVADEGDEAAASHPIGTGPFKFVEWQRGQNITLEANPDYWGVPPLVSSVAYQFIPEPSTRVAALLSGEVDLIQSVPPDQVDRIENSGEAKVAMIADGMIVSSYQFNVTSVEGPIQDVRVRRAISHAIDREAIIDSILNGQASARPIPLGPTDFGVNPDLQFYEFNQDLARELLAEAGYADGFEFTMHTSNGRYLQDFSVSQTIAANLAEVGITVNVQPEEWGVYIDMLAQNTAGPMYIIGWGGGLFDANELYFAFSSDSTYATFGDPEIDELLGAAQRTNDEASRLELYYQAQELLVDRVAFTMAYQANAIYGLGNQVSWTPTLGEYIDLRKATFA